MKAQMVYFYSEFIGNGDLGLSTEGVFLFRVYREWESGPKYKMNL